MRDGKLAIAGADSATLILTGATNFKNLQGRLGAIPQRASAAVLAAVARQELTTRCAPSTSPTTRSSSAASRSTWAHRPPRSSRPTSGSQPSPTGSDPALVALLFQFGRYLMIASSRPGGQPANLQGLWNDSNTPAWDSKYTDNINTEMNYWPVEETNLSECQLPLFDALKDLAASGAITAKEHYNARGWVLHHNFDLWRGTAPINASNHGIWQTGGAWLSTHLWEHYLFTGDKQFLRDTAYPLMKGAALFFVDALVKDPKTGYLITGPSNSPEQGGLVMGPTMDRADRAQPLRRDDRGGEGRWTSTPTCASSSTGMRKQIAPNQIGQVRPVAGVDGGQGRPEEPAPPRLAPLGRLSRAARSRRTARRTCSRRRGSR